MKRCLKCQKIKICHQHHLQCGIGRSQSKTISLCFDCHREVHDNPEQAYTDGFLVKKDFKFKNVTMKKLKKKVCTHSKSYYVASLDIVKCQFCGQEVESINFGTKKSKIDAKTSKKSMKMGEEVQDPRIKQGEILKNSLKTLKVKIKKYAYDPSEYKFLKSEYDRVKGEMIELQKSFED